MTKMTLLPVMMLVMSVVEGWDKEKTQCTTVAVNTTQETLCCQSLAPNEKVCQNNQTCIIKDLDGTVGYSKYCKVRFLLIKL